MQDYNTIIDQGYNNLPGIKRCSCWSHARRYFIEAVPKGKEYDYSNPAVQGVQFCSKLFDYERISKVKQHTPEQRKEYRLEKEKPVLDTFWIWLEQQKPRKGNRFEKAVNYALNRKDTLMAYLEDGHCSFSNNLSENAIRPFTVGRNYVVKHIIRRTGCSITLLKVLVQVHWCTVFLRQPS